MVDFVRICLGMVMAWGLLLTAPVKAQEASDWREVGQHLRLTDDLDRPQDGWCVDVVGSGPMIRFDMPLIGHNCKPGLYADEAVTFRGDGTVFFPAYEGCMTVMGLNQYALPGAALMIKECGRQQPFLNAPKFQQFTHHADGRLELQGSGLCLTLGEESQETFDPTHRWRTMSMVRCDMRNTSLSSWRFVKP